jgi:hypothetical protein
MHRPAGLTGTELLCNEFVKALLQEQIASKKVVILIAGSTPDDVQFVVADAELDGVAARGFCCAWHQ